MRKGPGRVVFSCRNIVFQRNGVTSRTFLVNKYYGNCIGGNSDYGWMMVVDVNNKWKPCVYDKHLTYPVFLYVNGSTAAALIPSGIALEESYPYGCYGNILNNDDLHFTLLHWICICIQSVANSTNTEKNTARYDRNLVPVTWPVWSHEGYGSGCGV
jgi:hypothetical protein